uniref:hypothetical protein n=1 Tax=Bartonella sp. CL41QHWL TaxID=3243527 RepID=UPI0035D0E153
VEIESLSKRKVRIQAYVNLITQLSLPRRVGADPYDQENGDIFFSTGSKMEVKHFMIFTVSELNYGTKLHLLD